MAPAVLRFPFAVLALFVAATLAAASVDAAPHTTPPRPLVAIAAPYPDGAHGDAAVTLDVVVGRDGVIASGRVAEGEEPFASAALAAMKGWRFEPATRGQAPVAARIRVRVEFHPPAPPVPSVVPAAPPSPSAAAPPASAAPSASAAPLASAAPSSAAPVVPAPPASAVPAPPLDSVHVHMPPPPIGRTRLRAEEIRDLPGAFGEPARAIESLPGVSPYASGLPFVSVRGAMPSNTAYTLDGMRLPAFFHYGLGVSTFHPALLESFDFFSGAAPAWSGRAFSVVAGETRAPALIPHAEASVRAIDSSALVETPFADGRGSLLVAGRYGYPGPIVSAINPDVRLQYANYQARATWTFERAGTLTALLVGMRDVYSANEGGFSAALNSVDIWSHRLDLRYDVDFASEGHARVALTLGTDDNAAYFTSVRSLQGRVQVDVPVVPWAHLRVGLDAYASWLSFDAGQVTRANFVNVLYDAFLIGAADANRASLGAWTDVVLRIGKQVEIVPGVRVDSYDGRYFSGTHTSKSSSGINIDPDYATLGLDELTPSPRLAAKVNVLPGLAFVASGGTATMAPTAAFPLPGNDYLTFIHARAPQSATMLDLGVQARLPGDVGLRAVAFQNAYRNMTLFPICLPNDATNGLSSCHADGVARGIELLARRDLAHRLGGWVSYTFTVAKLNAPNGVVFDDPLERRHQLSAVASYDLGAGFRAGGRVVFYTGAPFATTAAFNGNTVVGESIDPSAQRPSAFWRIDARVEKRWTLSSTASVGVALEWMNATLNREPEIACRIKNNGPRTCEEALRPLLTAPSITLSGQI